MRMGIYLGKKLGHMGNVKCQRHTQEEILSGQMAVWGKVGSVCKMLKVFWEKKDMYKCDPHSGNSCLPKCTQNKGSRGPKF